MRAVVLLISLVVAVSAGAAAQTRDTVLSPLASPGLAADAKPSDMLRAAQAALVAGRSGQAQEALEMAQTRMLDRSVPLGQTNSPSDNPTVREISQALQALGARDLTNCLQWIQTATASAAAQGL